MESRTRDVTLSKVPEVTLAFWIIKIAATTRGEDWQRHGYDDA